MNSKLIPFRVKGKPLVGQRILVTRASGQAHGLSQPLRDLGAEIIEIPTIEIHSPENGFGALDQALVRIDHYDTLVLTSVNGAEIFFERYTRLGLPIANMQHLLVVAIGPATAMAIQSEGVAVSIVPQKYVAESVLEALNGRVTKSSRILLVRAKVARDVLPSELTRMGAKVEVIEAYETRVPVDAGEKLHRLFADSSSKPHVITFTSSSTASNLLALLGDDARKFLHGVHLASIGPVTSATLRKAGFEPGVEAHEYTMKGLVDAITKISS
ncbi:MAG TPA: uroporphyrinogen-III synthase [Candidatus Angelobacter sp.]|nr:uroporphyrinogen-III synthase [Candidatus Angelobacter sp.]